MKESTSQIRADVLLNEERIAKLENQHKSTNQSLKNKFEKLQGEINILKEGTKISLLTLIKR